MNIHPTRRDSFEPESTTGERRLANVRWPARFRIRSEPVFVLDFDQDIPVTTRSAANTTSGSGTFTWFVLAGNRSIRLPVSRALTGRGNAPRRPSRPRAFAVTFSALRASLHRHRRREYGDPRPPSSRMIRVLVQRGSFGCCHPWEGPLASREMRPEGPRRFRAKGVALEIPG